MIDMHFEYLAAFLFSSIQVPLFVMIVFSLFPRVDELLWNSVLGLLWQLILDDRIRRSSKMTEVRSKFQCLSPCPFPKLFLDMLVLLSKSLLL